MTQPPNIREVDCCANCKFGDLVWGEYEIYCDKDIDFDCKPHNICDDFKREE